ncbi:MULTISPECIES: TrkH family potassium uptake protein [unclassified Algoriphagus]|jgi:trk system potassium uptake protein TrkH|uniref:TrkH family potassium uptake protein n=3 Tax=Algoriphagus TaxID=246875 RepID=UPI000C5BB7C5|nr:MULTISPECIES: TrkH family potassium uptake protein [unclassified Algoriphagus]MAL11842.1 potassium transporter [Algoriphagus sp.]QYH38736.1 TrkH family potassium uptake protein [Algoriphagus sp. NBT04N3]HAD50549.1 potassium transporter [Algoriphagus sp.]HAH36693.1 potassium transporter [Algoriphagus sp.]HCB45724.1 potassium transporter [Algoriphagus sp.]|tara:strand:- start:2939 stop:4387 length:1449 start_codon:yes stop_codon:yes gene_type:complete
MIHFKEIAKIMGALLVLISILMLPAAGWSIYFGEDPWPILVAMCISALFGAFFFSSFSKQDQNIRKREGYLIVALSWVFMTLFGMLPFILSAEITSFHDALFETMSGLTTTGASILTDIEAMPKGLLFWRSMTQWIGGLGIIVLTVAIFPLLGIGGIELFVAESPGPTSDKVHPRISETAKRLWYVYVGLTLLATLLYWVGGMTFYDAINHALTTLATGGFSTKNASMAYYDSAFIQYVAIVFMFLAGTNFTIIYFGLIGKFRRVLRSDEFKTYAFALLGISVILFYPIFAKGGVDYELAFRKSLFQVVSLVTTTGYVTDDYTQYGQGMSFIFFMLLFLGGSAGSTAGGIKFVRHLTFIKNSWLEFKRLVHPRAIVPLMINGDRVTGRIITHIMNFLLIYLLTFVIGALVLSLMGYDLPTSLGAVATCLGNVGPAIGEVGPVDNFAFFSGSAKIFLSFIMLLGRLELFTILILFTPFFWRAN